MGGVRSPTLREPVANSSSPWVPMGPGRSAAFEANLTKGMLVAPVRSHSGFSSRVSLGIPQISLGGPVFLRLAPRCCYYQVAYHHEVADT